MIGEKANDRQVGGNHYKKAGETGEEHWDRVARINLDYFQGCITKYVERWRDKGGIQDLEKARHYLDKYIEVERAKKLRAFDMETKVERPYDPEEPVDKMRDNLRAGLGL